MKIDWSVANTIKSLTSIAKLLQCTEVDESTSDSEIDEEAPNDGPDPVSTTTADITPDNLRTHVPAVVATGIVNKMNSIFDAL